MSKPKILHAMHELDENGFYDKSTYLGDIRTSPTCLDSTLENGIYAFTGGETSPTDTTGIHKWSLVVRACQDCTSVEQIAERLDYDKFSIKYNRYYNDGTWSEYTLTDPAVVFTYDASGNPVNFTITDIDLAIKANKLVYVRTLLDNNSVAKIFSYTATDNVSYYFVGPHHSVGGVARISTCLVSRTTGKIGTFSSLIPLSLYGDNMLGELKAYTNTNYTTRQVRNIILVADGESIPTGGNGDICLVYAP